MSSPHSLLSGWVITTTRDPEKMGQQSSATQIKTAAFYARFPDTRSLTRFIILVGQVFRGSDVNSFSN